MIFIRKYAKNFIVSAFVAIIVVGVLFIIQDVLRKNQGLLEENKPTQSTNAKTDEDKEENKYYAPNFTSIDLYGNPFDFYEQLEGPTVINFWATWCPECVDEMPYFQEMEDKYEDITFLMVVDADYTQEKLDEIVRYLNNHNLDLDNVILDIDVEIASAYGIPGYPSTVFIDREGAIVNGVIGAIDRKQLEYNILNFKVLN